MTLTIHRGTHEIGGSCVELESGGTRIVLDIGLPLEKLPEGEKPIHPKVSGLYVDSNDSPPDAVIVSHPHQDHFGFLPDIRPEIAVYIGESANKLIRLTGIFTNRLFEVKNPVFYTNGVPFNIGAFTITPYLIDHSAFDSYAFVITDGEKTVIYSGDFRSHGRKSKLFYAFLRQAPQQPDVLLMEGTSLPDKITEQSTHSSLSEKDVEEELTNLAKTTAKPIILIASGQNIDRIVSFYRSALRTKRTLVIDVYVANVLNELHTGTKLPYPSKNYDLLRVFFPRRTTTMLKNNEQTELIYPYVPYKITREQMAEISGSLMFMVRPSFLDDLERMDFIEGAEVVYSQWAGYQKEPYYEKFLKYLEEKHTHFQIIHSSGHASLETLQKMVSSIKPKCLIPIHTQNPEYYRNFGCNTRLLSDDEVIEI